MGVAMRILHTADWHLGDRLGRIDRTNDLRRAVERIADYAEREKAHVLLVAGDLFSDLSRPDGLRQAIEHLQQVLLPYLGKGGTVLALTGNHDNESFCQTLRHAMMLAAPGSNDCGEILAPGRFYLCDTPSFWRLPDDEGGLVQFLLMPYPTPRRYLDGNGHYRSREDRNRALAAAFCTRLDELKQHSEFDPHRPTVLAAHVHLQGARLASPFRISDRETIVFNGDLPLDYNYAALGHIHEPQCLHRAWIRYSGSIERLDLGERQDEKSVTLVDVGRKSAADPVCLPLEATPIYEVEINDPPEELPGLRDRYPDADRALVRLHVRYQAGRDNLEEVLRELDRIFPRWYDREWREASEVPTQGGELSRMDSRQNYHDTVIDYLQSELADHADREALLQLAEELLAREQP
jgi:DNA repair protein SbcD/Mre11